MATQQDKIFDMVKQARERSGATIGPRKPLSPDMLKRIQEDMDKNTKKTSASSPDETPTTFANKGGVIKKMANGGFVRAADGVASRGKTKGKMITMKKGGKC